MLCPRQRSDADRFAALQAAELIVSSALDPLPATPASCAPPCRPRERPCRTGSAQFQAIQTSGGKSFATLYSSTTALFHRRVRFAAIRRFRHRRSRNHDHARHLTRTHEPIVASRKRALPQSISGLAAAASAASACGSGCRRWLLRPRRFWAMISRSFPNSRSRSARRRVGERNQCFELRRSFHIPEDNTQHRLPHRRMVLRALPACGATSLLGICAHAGDGIRYHAARAHADSAALLRRRAVARAAVSRIHYTITQRPPALHLSLLAAFQSRRASNAESWSTSGRRSIPATTRDTGITFNYDASGQRTAANHAAGDISVRHWLMAMGRSRRRVKRDTRPRQEARRRTGLPRSDVYSRFLPATVTASTTYGITIATRSPPPTASWRACKEEPNA